MKPTLLALLLLFWGNLFSQQIDKQKIDKFLNYIEERNGGIGSVSVFRDGKEVYNRSFGQGKLTNVNYNHDTKYQIASVTKMVTATLILKLIEDGKLKLETPLAEFYPEISNSAKITINNLLGHTSGLGNFAVRDGAIWVLEKVSEQEIFNEIKKQGVSFQPGEKVAYSNSAYILLRMILEKKYKKDFNKVVNQEIIKPLGLKDFASVKSQPTNTFRSYVFKNYWTEIKDIDYLNVIGVGDIASTTKDMNILINGMFSFKLINKKSLEIMKPVIGKEDWGRGLALFPYGDNLFFGHGGDVLGSHSRLIYNPKDNLSIAYCTNGERIATNVVLNDLVSIIYDIKFGLPEVK